MILQDAKYLGIESGRCGTIESQEYHRKISSDAVNRLTGRCKSRERRKGSERG